MYVNRISTSSRQAAVPPGRVTSNYATCRVALQCALRETCCFSRFAPPNRINSTRLRLREREFSITVFFSSARVYAVDILSNFTGQLFITFFFFRACLMASFPHGWVRLIEKSKFHLRRTEILKLY